MNPPTPHTPTPLPNWTVRELCGQIRICRDRAFGEEVLCIVKQAETSEETENRIQMILRACNSHAVLVAAVEKANDRLRELAFHAGTLISAPGVKLDRETRNHREVRVCYEIGEAKDFQNGELAAALAGAKK
jgi:hypothetical protein